ncbi:MAG TPA: glutamate--tRNA ligase family protein [Puia sp.]|nr:glutamate--tRNA ligase family protein [Puia sp.]
MRTRLAPTPSGFLHLGNILSFIITARLAKTAGAKVLLRIDDLDRERVEERYVQDIFETLEFLGVPWDEGPRDVRDFGAKWSQIHRMKMYEDALQDLRAAGILFACTCSRGQIARESADGIYPGTCRDKGISLDAQDVSWRIRTDMLQELVVHGSGGEVVRTQLDVTMQDFVVRKKDGYPAYQLTSILDDLYFGVDLIVRGQDLWPSTLAQLYLASFLPGGADFKKTRFYHHELLKDKDGGKLSKSAGATSVQFLRKEGRSPEDIFRMIGAL